MEIAYFGFLTGTLVSGLLVNYFFELHVFAHWRRMLTGYLLVALPFIFWDVYATHHGHWSFNPDYITGLKIGNLPIEEVLFFFVIPFTMLTIWLLIQKRRQDKKMQIDRVPFRAVSTVLFLLALLFHDSSYTFIVFFLGGIFSLAVSLLQVVHTKNFWLFQFWLLFLFFVCNTYLTAIPIVEYGEQAITNVRIGTIPIEDFVYNFILVNGFILIATNRLQRKH